MSPLEGLNERQREAVLAGPGPVAVLAGPGTGKTHALARRAARILSREGGSPGILAVTFTRAAARELRDRLAGLLAGAGAEEALAGARVTTFHAAALGLLREHGAPFGPGVEFSVATPEEKAALLDGIVPRRGAARLLARVRADKQALQPPSTPEAREYRDRLRASRRLDFEDILLEACRLLEERPDAAAHARSDVRSVLVDEFQDTGQAQYRLLSLLAPEDVCVIGDPDQAIYGFAGGGFRPFERFLKDHPACRVIRLSENYRSQAGIVEAARSVIDGNPTSLPRDLEARLAAGLPIEFLEHRTDREEAELIARRVEGLLGGGSHFTIDSGWARPEAETLRYGLSDIAVLYRVHAQARLLAASLERAGLPFTVYGDSEDSADACEDYVASERGAPPAAGREERISLMTLHRAKGLEFPVVFIAGAEEGLLPYVPPGSAIAPRETVEEERRLFYVGMTRARSRLLASWSRKRVLFGRVRQGGPSRFLKAVAETLRTLRAPEPAGPRRGRQLGLFA